MSIDPAAVSSRFGFVLPGLSVLLLSLVLAAPAQDIRAAEPVPETVIFTTLHPDGVSLRAHLLRPEGPGPFPAVVLLHGCGGAVTARGRIGARHRDWMERFVANGIVALLVDSFTPRGYRAICEMRNRPITSDLDRPYDAYAALAWLRDHPLVRPERIAVMGWSHGANTVLATITEPAIRRTGWTGPGFVAAVAFYPGCSTLSRSDYRPTVPLLMQLGGADDWTPAAPCERLAARAAEAGLPVESDTYPGAHHGFDTPTGTVRARLAGNRSGTRTVHAGRNPEAATRAIARTIPWLVERLN